MKRFILHNYIFLKNMKSIRFYIDTVIFLDYLENRKEKSIQFITNLSDNEGWLGFTSWFTLLELIENKQLSEHMNKLAIEEHLTLNEIVRKRDQRNLSEEQLKKSIEVVERLFRKHKTKINIDIPNEKVFIRAKDLLSKINISVKDVIHVATALENKCEYFITGDSDLINVLKEGKIIKATSPDNLNRIINGENGLYNPKSKPEEIRGIVVEILGDDIPCGLYKRCPECGKTLIRGSCEDHGKVDGYYDLCAKAIIYNGLMKYDILLDKDIIEKFFDMTLDDAKVFAAEALDQRVVLDILERKLKSKYFVIKAIDRMRWYEVLTINHDTQISNHEILKISEKWIESNKNIDE